MKKLRQLVVLPVAGLLPLFLGACASGDLYENPYGEDPMMNPEFMQAMGAYMTPGEVHAEMGKLAGSWKTKSVMWMSEGGEPQTMEGRATFRPVLGGRFMRQSFFGDFGGMPFEGEGTMGYNNLTGEHWSLWLDTWSTGYMLATGTADDDGVINQLGNVQDVMTPQGRPWRTELRHVSDNEFVMHMFDTMPDGSEMKVMELTYTR